MINSFEIETQGNEEVLYLFLDFSVEFANLNKNNIKKQSITQEINDYLKKKKIKFKGTKIILMVGSLMIGTCLLKKPISSDISSYNYTTNIMTLKENIKITPSNEDQNDIKKEDKVVVKEISKNSTDKTNIKNNTTNKKMNTNASTNESVTKKQNTTSKTTTVNDNKKPTNSNSTSTKNTEKTDIVNKEMVSIKRSNGAYEVIELEEYLIGVVAAEMPASFHIEALKAQAIAARTYALKAMQNNVILTDTVSTQAYKDNNALKNMWGSSYHTYYNKIKKAVDATKGQVIYYNGSLINAYYHSTSNGYTEDSTAVFGSYPYLKSVDSSVDKTVSSYQKSVSFTYSEISNKLGVPITSLSNIDIKRNNSGRVDTIGIDNNLYSGVKFRTALGLRSTDFDIVLNNENVTITTKGYGHGVGMSQYGANGYAKKGWNYTKILKHYYSGITIEKY